MSSRGTLIQKGKERIFLFVKSQTRPNPTFPSVSAEHRPLAERLLQPCSAAQACRAALRERRKPNQATEKSTLTQKSVLQAVHSSHSRAGQPRRGLGSVWDKLTRHRSHSSQQGWPCLAQAASLCLVPELLFGAVLPGAPSRSQGHREQSSCHVVAGLCQAKGNKGR